jgi:ABC-2 type transport system permease protein
MLNLFKIEWLKIKGYRAFWVLFLAFLILFPLAFYFSASKYMEATSASAGVQGSMINSLIGSPFVFPKVWHTSAWIGGLFFVMIGMLYILLITNEVQYRTHRQNIIDGWSRLEFLKAKFSLLLFFVLVSTVLVFIVGLTTGLIYSPSTTDVFEGLQFLGYYALMSVLYLMAAFLVSILIKRTGLAIIIYFAVVFIVDNILWLSLTFNGHQIGYFMPLEASDSLVGSPFNPKIFDRRTVPDYALVLASLGYIGVYGYIIINYFRRSDLKT